MATPFREIMPKSRGVLCRPGVRSDAFRLMPSRSRSAKAQSTTAPAPASETAPAATENAAPRRLPKPRRGYGGRSAEQLQQERRNRLLAAALELFAERGYAKTPIEALCAQAKVTTRHFYEAFDGRESLLAELYQSIVGGTRRDVLKALREPATTPQQRMERGLQAFIRAYTDDPRCARIACIEIVSVSTEMTRQRRAAIDEFAKLIKAYADSLVEIGVLPARNYHLASIGVLGAIYGLMTEWLMAEPAPTIEAVTQEILRLFAALIAGNGAGDHARTPANSSGPSPAA